VPKRKRIQREHTEDWQTIQQYMLWPEQTAYELLRPVVLFGDPAIHRALYGWDKPKGPAKPKKEMPFKASRRHEYWSIDIRYIEHHQLPDIKGPVYVISILENFSRMLLASAISERQDTAAYLRVLAKALRNYGAPEAIVTDSGGVFYSKRAMAIYEALDIRKERIDPRQSWQNYIEAHFGIRLSVAATHTMDARPR
jgi:putative transposase